MNGPAIQAKLSEGEIHINAELRDRAESVEKLDILLEALVLDLPQVDIELYDIPETMPIIEGISVRILTLLARLAWWLLDRFEFVWARYLSASGKGTGVGSATLGVE